MLTTIFAAIVGHYVFRGTPIDRPVHLVVLGLILSVAGQVGASYAFVAETGPGDKGLGEHVSGAWGFAGSL